MDLQQSCSEPLILSAIKKDKAHEYWNIFIIVDMENIPHLPEIESNGTNVLVEVQLVIGLVFGVVDLWVHPVATVVGVGDLLGLPLTLQQARETI